MQAGAIFTFPDFTVFDGLDQGKCIRCLLFDIRGPETKVVESYRRFAPMMMMMMMMG